MVVVIGGTGAGQNMLATNGSVGSNLNQQHAVLSSSHQQAHGSNGGEGGVVMGGGDSLSSSAATERHNGVVAVTSASGANDSRFCTQKTRSRVGLIGTNKQTGTTARE